MKLQLAALILALGWSGCKEEEFKGRGGTRKGADASPGVATPTFPQNGTFTPTPVTSGGAQSPTTTPTGTTSTAGGTPTQTPVPTQSVPPAQDCNLSTMRWAWDTQRCPAGYVPFAADDSKTTFLACCPLPASDILTADAPVARAANCNDDEVVIGGAANGGVLCNKINLNRYAFLTPQSTCYLGSGASGGRGSESCTAPPATLQAMATKFGSDACLPVPYGGLIRGHNKNGKCIDTKASVLIFRDTGLAVPMFK